MGGTGTGTEESGWTKADLQKLLDAMKSRIPEHERTWAYNKGLKAVNWDEVAFPPFSPEACREKWMRTLQKMRKIRSLTELIAEAEEVIASPGTNSKVHPEIPKRPCPPNAIYFEENYAKYLKKHPRLNRKAVFKKLMRKYQVLPDEEKARYVEKFDVAMDEYTSRMQMFSKQYSKKTTYSERRSYWKKIRHSGDAPDGELCTEDQEAMPNKPPLNGYRLFCKEQCASMTGFSGNKYVTVWAERWRDLTESQRDEYSARCKELKRLYIQKLDTYLKSFAKGKRQQILNENGIKRSSFLKDPKTRAKKAFPGEPKMPSRTGSGIFYRNQMVLLKEKFPNSRERFAKVNQMWRELSSTVRKRYQREADEDIRKYSKALQTWFETLSTEEQQLFLRNDIGKVRYLNASQVEDPEKNTCGTTHGAVYRPSDSEDEAIEDSSSSSSSGSDEEENNLDSDEVKEEEDEDVVMFELF